MLITGWKSGANSLDAILQVSKHTEKTLSESKKLIEDALNGKIVKLEDDFVLREELENLKFIIE
jgi:hypothetical protein